jgi:hypothetical protein
LVHASEQHWAKPEHELPSAWHIPVPQVPFMQSFLQQSVLVEHICPSGLHVGGGMPHVPLLHALLQQSPATLQLEPSAAQLDD